MLFNYHFVPHSIEKFQEYLDHLVKQVWCEPTPEFSIQLLHPELQAIVEEISNDDKVKKDHLYGPIKRIYNLFKTKLNTTQRRQVATWYESNNDIEALCANDPQTEPGTYAQIRAINSDLEEELKGFCQSLFTTVIDLQAVRRLIGELNDHYKAFVMKNHEGKCPYCGITDMKGQHHRLRDAYDHYLPKNTYPFNTVNLKNLAPMCHECNSSYKLMKDPARHIDPLHKKEAGARRKAFYSYASAASGISINLSLKTANIERLNPAEIDIDFSAPGRNEELETWKEIFGIEERYKAKLCAKNDGKYWLTQVIEECSNAGKTAQEIIQTIERNAAGAPWADCNFLRRPFLKACQDIGLIEPVAARVT